MIQSAKSKLAVASLYLWANDLKKSKPQIETIKSKEVFNIVKEYSPSIGTNIHWRDTDFEVVDWSWWEKVLESPFWTSNQIKYISEVSDCEAFSLFFLSICELFLKTNGVFSVGGNCYWNTSNGEKSSSHRFNFIMAKENNIIGLWLVEPMYNKWRKLIKGQDKIIVEKVFGINQMTYNPTNIYE